MTQAFKTHINFNQLTITYGKYFAVEQLSSKKSLKAVDAKTNIA